MLSLKLIGILIILCTAYAFDEKVGKNCIEVDSFKLSWVVKNKYVDFVFKTKVSRKDNVWTAFGLSKDKAMVRYS